MQSTHDSEYLLKNSFQPSGPPFSPASIPYTCIELCDFDVLAPSDMLTHYNLGLPHTITSIQQVRSLMEIKMNILAVTHLR